MCSDCQIFGCCECEGFSTLLRMAWFLPRGQKT
ncbi:hypothetical protein V6Z11_A01G104900 [Gossypium hirsutum]